MIILASTSPRRIELMKQVGFEFTALSPKTEERTRRGESPQDMVVRLAMEKGLAGLNLAMREIHGSSDDKLIVVAADTTVVSPDGKKVLGKPASEKQAEKMLRSLAGKAHLVFTGYCIILADRGKLSRIKTRAVKTRVRMRKLTPQEIQQYVRTGEPMDKAGAYGAQGIGMGLIESIQGSYTNVVGLPIAQLLMDLEAQFGISPQPSRKRAR